MGTIVSQITSLTIVYSTVFFQTQIRENIKAPRHLPLCGKMASNAENISIWWRHHGYLTYHGFSTLVEWRDVFSVFIRAFKPQWYQGDVGCSAYYIATSGVHHVSKPPYNYNSSEYHGTFLTSIWMILEICLQNHCSYGYRHKLLISEYIRCNVIPQ